MASATATARADLPGGREPDEERVRRPLFRFGGSRLGGFILALNLLSLLILFGGALALNEWRQGLIEARQESLSVQAELLANVLREEGVTRGEPTPELDPIRASLWLTDRFIPAGQRVRLYDINGLLLVDSYQVTEAIGGRPLPAMPAPLRVASLIRPKNIRARLTVAANLFMTGMRLVIQGQHGTAIGLHRT